MSDPRTIAALLARGQTVAAKAECERAIAAGASAELWRLLAMIESRLGDRPRAESAIAKALAADPGDPVSHNFQGVILAGSGRLEDACRAFDRACTLKPGFVAALMNRGNALLDLNRAAEALPGFEEAVAAEPSNADIALGRGRALLALGRDAEAASCFARAVALNPRHTAALNAHADALRRAKRNDEAMQAFDAALAIDPNDALALQNSATLLHQLGQLEPAIQRYELLIALLRVRPAAPEAFDYALGMTVSCRRDLCAWDGLAPLEAELLARVRTGESRFKPYLSLMIADDPALQALCAARTWRQQYEGAAKVAADFTTRRRVENRLRIGYLSGDFRDHPCSWLLAGLYERHDRARFEVHAYSSAPDDGSAMRRRLGKAFDRFVDISEMSDEAAAQRIAGDGIDVLVDLSGLTTGNRAGVVERRPAPVIAHYLGYPGPLGTRAIDYMIADAFIVPPGEDSHYGAVARLAATYLGTDYTSDAALPVPSRAPTGLPRQGFVFCAFGQPLKLSPELFDVWMRILARIPGSVLWLLDPGAAVARNLRAEAQRRGIDPARLVFAPRVDHAAHMARQALADLVLDTWPCGAHTNASDALWAGVPVITRPGHSFASRVAGSLLHAVELPELIVNDLRDYEDLAVDLAQAPERLDALRGKLAASRATSPLFDTDFFRRNMEAAYSAMWERFAAGQPPQSFSV